MITGVNEDQKIAEGDFLRLECGANIYNFSSDIVWRKDGELIENLPEVAVEETNTKYSWRKTITWRQITKDSAGVYECEIFPKETEESEPLTMQLAIAVHDTEVPVISPNFNQTVMQQSLGDSLKLECLVRGLPAPSLLWYKNDEIFVIDETSSDDNSLQRVMIDNDNSSITFSVLRLEDAGMYKCFATNRVGSDFKEILLEIPSEYLSKL